MRCEIETGCYTHAGGDTLEILRDGPRVIVRVGGQQWTFNENGFHVAPTVQTPATPDPEPDTQPEAYVGTPWRRGRRGKGLTGEDSEV